MTDGESYTHSELDGSFTLFPPAGTYDVTVSAYGYVSATTPSVAITDGNTTTVNAALVARPRATVTGKVTDASGPGWPL